jgi:hypothetical protein
MGVSSFRWHTRWHTLGALAVLPVWAALTWAAPAGASCVYVDPEQTRILWSYPAQGATDVPTNVDLWVARTDGSAPLWVRLGEAELPELELPFNFDLGELEPNTEYTLDVQGPSEDSVLKLTFTTGIGPAAADPNAAPGKVTTSSSFEDYDAPAFLCQAVVSNQGCFDTPPNLHYELEPSGNAGGWLIVSNALPRAILWPGECGAPHLVSEGGQPCVTLYGIDASGAPHAGEEVCAPYQGEGDDVLLVPSRPTTGAPGVVLRPASGDEAESESASTPPVQAPPPQASGCALPSAPGGGPSGVLLALLGVVGRWRAARARCRGPR